MVWRSPLADGCPSVVGSRAGAGNNLVEASATGVASTADFSASATAGAPSLMVVDSGNNQTGVVGQALPLPFIAIVTDANNNRLANVPVSFEVKGGAGSFGGSATAQLVYVTFPSFHASLAVLTGWALMPLPVIGPLALLLNAAIIVAAIGAGGHYLPDVMAGAGLAFAFVASRSR